MWKKIFKKKKLKHESVYAWAMLLKLPFVIEQVQYFFLQASTMTWMTENPQ